MAGKTKPSTQAIKLLAQARMHVTLGEVDAACAKIDAAVVKLQAIDAKDEEVQDSAREAQGLGPRRRR